MIEATETAPFALDGIHVKYFVRGKTYELDKRHEEQMVAKGCAVFVEEKVEPEEEFALEFALTIKGKEELIEYAGVHGIDLDPRMTLKKMKAELKKLND